MWIIFQAFVRVWTWISTRLFTKKNAQTPNSDIEKVPSSGERMQATWARNQYEERIVEMFQDDWQSRYQREVAMFKLQRNTVTSHSNRKYDGLRRGTVGPIENDPYPVAPPRPKRAKQPRKHSAKYRLRQGEHVDNWDCELSDLYGKRSPPQPFTPSPLLSGSTPLVAGEDIREETYRFPGRRPTLPCTSSVPTSGILRSPFLGSSEPQSSKQSPFLALQFTDLTQTIMTDFKPVGYSTNALSAVTDTFWDAPAAMPAKPARVFGASYNQSDANDTLAASYSVGHIWSLPSFPNPDLIYEEI